LATSKSEQPKSPERRKVLKYGITAVVAAAAGGAVGWLLGGAGAAPGPGVTQTVEKTLTVTQAGTPTVALGYRGLLGNDMADMRAIAAVKAMNLPAGTKITCLNPSGSRGNFEFKANADDNIFGGKSSLEYWKEQTGVDVEIVEAPINEVYEKAMQESVAKIGVYDVIDLNHNFIGDVVESGLAVNLDQWVQKYDPELSGPMGYAEPLGRFLNTYGGHVYSMGSDADVFLMYLRKDYLADPDEMAAFKSKYGYDIRPDDIYFPETWDQYHDLIKFFDRPDEGMRGAWFWRSRFFAVMGFLGQFISNGGKLFDDNMNPAINGPEGQKVVQDMIDIMPYMDPVVLTAGYEAQYPDFYANKKAFTTFGWPSIGRYATDPGVSAISDAVSFHVMPGYKVPGAEQFYVKGSFRASGHTFGWINLVSNYSKNKELAYLFAQWRLSPVVGGMAVTQPGGYEDPYRGVWYDKVYPGPAPIRPDELVCLRATLPLAVPDIQLRGSREYDDILDKNLQATFAGQIGPKDALDETAAAWQKVTDKYGRDKQIQAWKYLRLGYPEHVKKYFGWT